MTVRKRGRGQSVPTQTKKRSCDGKRKFWTHGEAVVHMSNLIARGAREDAVKVYHCTFGTQAHWHVGHAPGNLGRR